MDWKLAVFDWDGTLADSIPLSHRITGRIFSRFGLKVPSYAEYMRNYHTSREGFLRFYRTHGVSESVTDKELTDLWLQFSLEYRPHLELRPGAINMLRICRLKRIRTAVVSANTTELITSALAGFGAAHLVDYVQGYADRKAGELRRVLAHFGLEPSDAVYVDDTPNGILAGLSVGMDTIALEDGAGSDKDLALSGPRFQVKHCEDVVRLLADSSAAALEV